MGQIKSCENNFITEASGIIQKKIENVYVFVDFIVI